MFYWAILTLVIAAGLSGCIAIIGDGNNVETQLDRKTDVNVERRQ